MAKKTKPRTGPASFARVAEIIRRPALAGQPLASGEGTRARVPGPYSGTSAAPTLRWAGAISRDGHGPFYVLELKFFDPAERRWFDVTPLKGLGPRPARALIESLGLDLELPELPPAVEPHRMKVK